VSQITSKDTVNSRESAQSGTDFVITNEKPPTFNDRAVHQISKAVRKIRTFNPSKFKRKQVIATASTHGLLALVNTWALFLFFVSTSCTNEVRPFRYTARPSIAELYEMQYALDDLRREAYHLPKLVAYSRSQEAYSFRPMSHITLATAISPIALLPCSSMAVTRLRQRQQSSICEAPSEASVNYATLLANVVLSFVTTVVIILLLQPVEIQNIGIYSSPRVVFLLHCPLANNAVLFTGSAPQIPQPAPLTDHEPRLLQECTVGPDRRAWATEAVACDDNGCYIAEAIRQGTAMAVSDGSYKDGISSAAFVIEGPES